MKLIAQVKLQPTNEQAQILKKTLEVANAAANFVSEIAWANNSFKQYDLHKLTYYDVRKKFKLSAQTAVRIISKVADAYKLDKKAQREFKSMGSIAYDERIMTWKVDKFVVSLWTVGGRIKFPFVVGQCQLEMLQHRQGEADLVYRNGDYYIYQTCEIDEQSVSEVNDFLGVDMGIVNLATDSDGNNYSGQKIEVSRSKYEKRRQSLQKVATKSSRKRLRQASGRQERFQKDINHTISKEIVARAKDTGRGIAIEDLKQIRSRTTVRRSQRSRQSNWSFGQLRIFLEYKARLYGVPIVSVDPRNTSKSCSLCGHCEDANRPTRDSFQCCICGFVALADYNAAQNIRARATVNAPTVSTLAVAARQGQAQQL